VFFKLTKGSAFHSGLKLYETLSFFNFFAGGAPKATPVYVQPSIK
jgi:hypothetical protein